MKKFLALAFMLSVISLSAQIASMEAYVIQEGKDSDYRKIEEFVAPLKAMAIKEGNLMQWIVMKRKSGGDLSSIDKTKAIANYLVFNVSKDRSQMDSDKWNNYPSPNNLSETIVKNDVTVKCFFAQKTAFLLVFLFFFGDIYGILSK